tara:strand:+ start:1090 stop:1356 length:267 start_codon:yes stop_codon:yes gene_type:complete
MKTLLKYLALRMDTNRPVSREELAIYLSTIDMVNESHFKEEITKLYEEAIDKVDIAENEIHNSNIGRKFMEDSINDMYNEQDDYHTGF